MHGKRRREPEGKDKDKDEGHQNSLGRDRDKMDNKNRGGNCKNRRRWHEDDDLKTETALLLTVQ
jgi:hypothetical protein